MGEFGAAVLLISGAGIVLVISFLSGLLEGRSRSSVELIQRYEMKFYAADKEVVCPHCGETSFSNRQVQLNTWFATFLKYDWLNRSGTVLECMKCGQMQWFSQKPMPKD